MDKEYKGTYFVEFQDKIIKKIKVKNEEDYNNLIKFLRVARPIYEIRFIPINSIFCS